MNATAQVSEGPIRVFGYFQSQFTHNDGSAFSTEDTNTFLLQQLNIFLQKDLSRNFAALIDLEVLNSFSTRDAQGDLNLQEAWVRYRAGPHFNIKVGLQIPTFNHLNTLKNRTPILPYVVRPLVYESSFTQIASLEEYIPDRAFVQAYGTLASGAVKFDYSIMLGNSPNERTNEDRGQSGADTTNTVLIGGRIGIRTVLFKLGGSVTRDKVNRFLFLADNLNIDPDILTRMPRTRFGIDARFSLGFITFEGEWIRVQYDEDVPLLSADKTFYYGTLSSLLLDRLTVYATYWVTRENRAQFLPDMEILENLPIVPDFLSTVRAPSFGAAFDVQDRVVLKGQFTHVRRSTDNERLPVGPSYNTYSLGVSVFF